MISRSGPSKHPRYIRLPDLIPELLEYMVKNRCRLQDFRKKKVLKAEKQTVDMRVLPEGFRVKADFFFTAVGLVNNIPTEQQRLYWMDAAKSELGIKGSKTASTPGKEKGGTPLNGYTNLFSELLPYQHQHLPGGGSLLLSGKRRFSPPYPQAP